MATSDFELIRHCGKFDSGPLRTVQARWQKVRGRVKADLRVFIESDGGGQVATRAGLSLEPELLLDLRRLVERMIQTCPEPNAIPEPGAAGEGG
jgi:hypothetical protein